MVRHDIDVTMVDDDLSGEDIGDDERDENDSNEQDEYTNSDENGSTEQDKHMNKCCIASVYIKMTSCAKKWSFKTRKNDAQFVDENYQLDDDVFEVPEEETEIKPKAKKKRLFRMLFMTQKKETSVEEEKTGPSLGFLGQLYLRSRSFGSILSPRLSISSVFSPRHSVSSVFSLRQSVSSVFSPRLSEDLVLGDGHSISSLSAPSSCLLVQTNEN